MGRFCDRAWLLYQQERYALAAKELSQELAESPNSSDAHALLALCVFNTGDRKRGRKLYLPSKATS